VALELAYRWKDSFPKQSILWIHAGNRDRLDQSFRDILGQLKIPETSETDPKRLVGDWLQRSAAGRWLMIVDNVDSEDVVFEMTGNNAELKLVSCIPKTATGSVLFTSRYKRIAMKLTDELIGLDAMMEDEANALLKRSLKDDYKDSEPSKQLLEELGYIPLAISQAAAFIRENCIGITEYLDIYHESEDDRIALLGEDLSIKGPDGSGSVVPSSVLSTWFISFNHLKNDASGVPLASDLLSVMSFMDSQKIPKLLLQMFSKKSLKVHYVTAFGTLKAMSLISESEHQTFSMHRLVQLSMRRWLKQEGTEQAMSSKAISMLAEAFPDGSFKTWKECSALIVHAEAVLRLAVLPTSDFARAKLLANVATFQNGRGQYDAAELKLREVVELKAELLGRDNLETLQATDSLALCLRRAAKFDAAEELARKTCLEKEKLLGEVHVETLKTAQLLAALLGDRGSHQLAEERNRQIWTARVRILGFNQPETLESAAMLALSLWELGRYTEAETLARDVLAGREKMFGEDNPDTLDIAGTLGIILEVQGKLSEAKELKRHILEVRERVLGANHPATAASLHDMAWILHQQGLYSEAGDYYTCALDSKLKLLGEDHPETLTTMCNIPVFLCDQGHYEDAEKASRRIVQKFEKIQGLEHPQTLDALGDLAVVLRHVGKLDAAAEAAQRSITGREKVIGKNHPWTLPTVIQHGYILTLQGDHSRGEEIIRIALAGLETELGKDHPAVNTGATCLSKNLLRQNQRLEEAEDLGRRALDGRTRALGPDHPYTFKSVHHLARVLMAQERYHEAEVTCRRALDGLQMTLGTEHPDVSICDEDYERILRELVDENGGIEGAALVDLRETELRKDTCP